MSEDSPIYTFSPEKNLKLKEERGISFEEVIAAIENGDLLDVVAHTGDLKYEHQKVYVVYAKDYVYLVPFVVDAEGGIFLKTIIPSRKAYRDFLKEKRS